MTPKQEQPFLEARQEFRTQLAKRAKAPDTFDPNETPPAEATQARYPSGSFTFKTWYAFPKTAKSYPLPAIVYFHNGFALTKQDWSAVKPFLDAGFAVMTPTVRGENGNAGDFELWYGELDDAVSAVKWFAQLPGIDRQRIYAFGHSAGGNLAALLSLVGDDVPLAKTGSCGSLYPYDVFREWKDIVPFDTRNPRERQLRLLLGNTWWMKRPHLAYVGEADPLLRYKASAEAEVAASKGPLSVHVVPGDHGSSLHAAIGQFIEAISK